MAFTPTKTLSPEVLSHFNFNPDSGGFYNFNQPWQDPITGTWYQPEQGHGNFGDAGDGLIPAATGILAYDSLDVGKPIYRYDTEGNFSNAYERQKSNATADFLTFLAVALSMGTLAPALAAGEAVGGAAAGSFGALDLGGGLSMLPSGEVLGSSGLGTLGSSISNVGIMDMVGAGGLEGLAGGATMAAPWEAGFEGSSALLDGSGAVNPSSIIDGSSFANPSSVFNAAKDSQLANSAIEAGAPGFEQFGGDALSGYTSAGIPSVNISNTGTPTSSAGSSTSLPKIPSVPGTGGGSSSSGGSSSGGLNLGSLLSLIGGGLDWQRQQQASTDMLNYLKERQALNDNLYKPGSPEYNALWDEMSRKDAAAGRNSQYGPRSVDLAARIAQIKADANTKLTTGISNVYANALNQRASAPAGLFSQIPGILGNGSGGTLNLSSIINNLGGLLGNGSTNLGSGININPDGSISGIGNDGWDITGNSSGSNEDIWNMINNWSM